jgi:hypothetical protein
VDAVRVSALLAAALALAGPLLADTALPDPSKGEINGRTAVLYWPRPAEVSEEEALRTRLPPPENCEVHLVPEDNYATELRYACGKWFQPPAAVYQTWVETPDRLSHPFRLLYSGQPFSGHGIVAFIPIAKAGRVALSPVQKLQANEELRLISIDNHRRADSQGKLFDRRVQPAAATRSVVMPLGRVVAGKFDRKTNDALSLSRPVDVAEGSTAIVSPQKPANGSGVLVILTRPAHAPASKENSIALELDDGDRKRPPDVLVDANR